MTSVYSSITDFADVNGLIIADHHLFDFLHKQFSSELNHTKKYFIAKRLIREIQFHFIAIQKIGSLISFELTLLEISFNHTAN